MHAAVAKAKAREPVTTFQHQAVFLPDPGTQLTDGEPHERGKERKEPGNFKDVMDDATAPTVPFSGGSDDPHGRGLQPEHVPAHAPDAGPLGEVDLLNRRSVEQASEQRNWNVNFMMNVGVDNRGHLGDPA